MAKEGKRLRKVREKAVRGKVYEFDEACKVLAGTASAKFDETVEIAVVLGVDPRKADQNVRGSVALPHGLGKTIRVAVFAKGEKSQEAKDAGADIVGAEDLVEMIKNGQMDFESVIATPDMMAQVGKVGKILGPRGLMPSPKVGTVTMEVGEAVRSVKAGRAEYRVEKAGIVHAGVGKVSFDANALVENVRAFADAVTKAKPAGAKGNYVKKVSVTSTMGPGLKVDVATLAAAQ